MWGRRLNFTDQDFRGLEWVWDFENPLKLYKCRGEIQLGLEEGGTTNLY